MIDYDVVDRIATITLNRPEKLNALNNAMIIGIAEALWRLDDDDSADIGIIHGVGRAFSTGADTKERLPTAKADTAAGTPPPSEHTAFLESKSCKPVIAAVHGYAIGHAFGTAMYSDLFVAEENTQFKIPEAVMGYPAVSFWNNVASSAGWAFATDIVLTSRMFTATEAYNAGLVTRLVPAGEHLNVAQQIATEMTTYPQANLREMVRLRRTRMAELLNN
jgi:enoyl-CoA hydratase